MGDGAMGAGNVLVGGNVVDEGEDLDDTDIVLNELATWQPVPIQAARLFKTVKTCNKDIVVALIDVLGNKEYFIKEYVITISLSLSVTIASLERPNIRGNGMKKRPNI